MQFTGYLTEYRCPRPEVPRSPRWKIWTEAGFGGARGASSSRVRGLGKRAATGPLTSRRVQVLDAARGAVVRPAATLGGAALTRVGHRQTLGEVLESAPRRTMAQGVRDCLLRMRCPLPPGDESGAGRAHLRADRAGRLRCEWK